MASAGELTVSQGGLGSPPYMSPEQVKSAKHVDFRADIYSLGATLYALLAGKAPFAGTSAYEIMHKVVTDAPVSLRELKPDLSRAMETTVARCLQKDPEKRFASYQDLCGALEHVSGGTGAEALTAESVQGVVTSARAGGGEPPREQDRGRKETEQPAVPWFYAMKGKRTGPVEFAVLRDLVEKGMLKGEDLVWRKGLKEWAPVSRVEGLFPDLGSENRLSPRLSGSQVDAGSKPPPLTKAPSTAPEIVRWYYADGNDRSGPVDWDTLQRFAATNQITPRTLVWKEGMKDWQPAANVGELVFNVACTEGVPVEHDASAYERPGLAEQGDQDENRRSVRRRIGRTPAEKGSAWPAWVVVLLAVGSFAMCPGVGIVVGLSGLNDPRNRGAGAALLVVGLAAAAVWAFYFLAAN